MCTPNISNPPALSKDTRLKIHSYHSNMILLLRICWIPSEYRIQNAWESTSAGVSKSQPRKLCIEPCWFQSTHFLFFSFHRIDNGTCILCPKVCHLQLLLILRVSRWSKYQSHLSTQQLFKKKKIKSQGYFIRCLNN